MGSQYREGVLHIDDVAATTLVERFGSPLYVYDLSLLRRQIDRLRSLFSSIPFQPFYAMKANANLEILRLMAREGLGCDAVSPGEVFLALQAGFAPSNIWFTCSNVSDEDLREIARAPEGILVNLNSMSEIDRLVALGRPSPVALRVNPDVGAGHHRDVVTGGYGVKFGIDVAELADARMILEDNGFVVAGLHAHIGSGVESVAPLLESASRLVGIASGLPDLRWLNLGGGINIPYRPGDGEFPLDEYAAGLASVAGSFLRERKITAILEPGRFLVGPAGTLLTRVTTRKISAGHEWIGCDTGFNHLVRPSRYGSYHHILNASRGGDEWLRERMTDSPFDENGYVIAGNICESGDVFTRDGEEIRPRRLPPTRVGDLLAICDAGAYGFSMASNYNSRLLPAEVLVSGSDVRLIRRRQTYEELVVSQF